MSLPMQKLTLRARATGAGFGVSETKGTTQIAVQLHIVDSEEYAGESIAWLGHFTDKAAARTIESLQHMGWQGDDLTELEELDAAGAERVLPEVVEIVCEPEEYNGEWRLKVRWINRPGAGKFAFKAPLIGAGLKAFAAQMKGTIRSAKGATGTRPAAPRPSNGGGSQPHPNAPGGYGGRKDEGDIPF